MKKEEQREESLNQNYHIVIEGELDPSWSEWLEGMQVVVGSDPEGKTITNLYGEVPDQAALRSILNRVWDLRLTLFSVTRIQLPPNDDPEEVYYE